MPLGFARAFGAFLAVAAIVGTQAIRAQEFPTKPIRLVLPAGAGSSVDAQFRFFAQKLKDRTGWNVITDNLPGGNFVPSAMSVVNSPADGHSLLVFFSSLTVVPYTVKDIPFNTLRDFTPLSRIIRFDQVLVIHPSIPAKNLDELIAYSKANPGKLSYGGSGSGGVQHLTGESFRRAVGLDMTYIPYQKTQAITDVLSGVLSANLSVVAEAKIHSDSGKLRALVTLAPQRAAGLPDVPSTGEHPNPIVKAQDFHSWGGIAVKAGTPDALVARLARETQGVMNQQDTKDFFAKLGAVAMSESPAEFRRKIEQELERWGKVVKELNIVAQ